MEPTRQFEHLPDLPDIMDAGYGLTDALAFWSEMMNSPGIPAGQWWERLRRARSRH